MHIYCDITSLPCMVIYHILTAFLLLGTALTALVAIQIYYFEWFDLYTC